MAAQHSNRRRAVTSSWLLHHSIYLGLRFFVSQTLGAGHRLMLHGLAVECLHAYLVKQKRLKNQVRPGQQPADGASRL